MKNIFSLVFIMFLILIYGINTSLVAPINSDTNDNNFVQMKSITKSKNLVRSLINANNRQSQSDTNSQVIPDDKVEYEYEQEGLDSNSGNFVSHGNGIDIVLEDKPKTFFNHDPTPVEIVTPPYIPITPSKEEDENNNTENSQNQQSNNDDNQQNQQTTNTTIQTSDNQNTSSKSTVTDNSQQSANTQSNTQLKPEPQSQKTNQINVLNNEIETNTAISKREETTISTQANVNINNPINSEYIIVSYLYLVLFITLL